MRPVSIVLACTILGFSAVQSPSLASGCRQLLESDVKIASMRVYADVLTSAAAKGWNYTPESIVSGSKRHFEEMKLQLIAAGFEIVPVGAHPHCTHANSLTDSQSTMSEPTPEVFRPNHHPRHEPS
ncbi:MULTISPECIES: hypothetical protein [unclassified Mesorhizobium]|uniref:hypothetical protein n=1 Tax=unclassified Mesorhizobium TaxID=325217 RepID=UPI000FD91EF6|nr:MULTISPECIES: hypothetical protein [unclassified Mesorhizobium]TGQ30625.1 hypothetical protein EN859_031385 [Mesorhizobium sp. M00.F.Ca.ET.216.01.1.1]TIS60060.1 MAG: hypothetical protein E5W91_00400 [Mesorhizobium sp.]TIS89540.1 MAG: hypothetical protein E5W89_15940 [Mesorhizobium sp.]TJW10490.1 MAG: hypothetical protein E5W82_19650 [Mesorhizobium sp.]TJW39339.1 MAG: hypothetical protein E5W83_31080 [Mesorhizobium sp.]